MPLKLPEADTTIIQDKKILFKIYLKLLRILFIQTKKLNLMKLMVCLSIDKNLSQ